MHPKYSNIDTYVSLGLRHSWNFCSEAQSWENSDFYRSQLTCYDLKSSCVYIFRCLYVIQSYCILFLSSSSCGICTALHPRGVGSEPSNKRLSWQGIVFTIPPPITPWYLPRAGWGGTWRFPLFSCSPGWNIAGQVTGREMLREICELSCGFGG